MPDRKKLIAKMIILILFSAVILLYGIYSVYRIEKYPQLSIENEELYGEQGENLSDFQLREDGSLLSRSDASYVEYILPQIMDLKEVEIEAASVSPENMPARLQLILQGGIQVNEDFNIHSGNNKIKINDGKGLENVWGIRFVLAAEKDRLVKVDHVIVNHFYHETWNYFLLISLSVISLVLSFILLRRGKDNDADESDESGKDAAGKLVVCAISFLLCIFAPLDLYFNNWNEFSFDVYNLLPLVFIMFLAGVLAGSIIVKVSLLHQKPGRFTVIFCFIFLICCYIQGNYLTKNLPPLDGTDFAWSDYSAGKFESVVLWYAVSFAVILVLENMSVKKFYSFVRYISVGITAVLAVTLCMECFLTYGYQDKLNIGITTKGQFEMSKNRNFIILMLDALDSGTFYEIMKDRPDDKDIFADFTYFPNTLGAYPYTSRAVPFILSGEWFENKELFVKYNENAYKNTGLFAKLEKENYKLGVYETSMPLTDKSILRFDNVFEYDDGIKSYLKFAKLEYKLTGFKYAPFQLKCFYKIDKDDLKLDREKAEDGEYPVYLSNNRKFYQNIQKEEVTYTEENCFKFIHLEGAHVPFRYDKELNEIENGTYEQSVEACITITDAFLEKLKNSGAYDHSVIIVMADHGYEWRDGYAYGRQNPLLMIKGLGEKHEMKISNAPVSFDDLQSAYEKLLAGKGGEDIFDWKEGDERKRRFLWYRFLDEDHMTEYFQTGDAMNPDTMYPAGQEFNR